MKTTEVLEQLRKENVRVPHSWAIMQSSSGVFLGFLSPDHDKIARKIRDSASMFAQRLTEIYRAEREAAKNSTLSELR
jgi:hypothetical protein